MVTPTIPRVFPATTSDYILRSKTHVNSYTFYEDSRPHDAATTTATLIAICLPGIGDTRRQFRFLAPLLYDRLGCRVLLGDLRGFGDSTSFDKDPAVPYSAYSPEAVADDVIQLMDELHATCPSAKFLLLGNSLAAGSMAMATQNRSSLVKALVLLGPILRDSPKDSWFRPLSHLLFPALYGRAVWMPFYRTLYPEKTKQPSDLEQEIKILHDHLRAKKCNITNVGKFARAPKKEATKALEALGKDPSLLVPVVAFYGRKDPDFEDFDQEIQWFQATLPHAVVEIDDDGGHFPHVESPEKIVVAIEKMLKQTK